MKYQNLIIEAKGFVRYRNSQHELTTAMQHLLKKRLVKQKTKIKKFLFFFLELVRFGAYFRIKQHTPPLVLAPANTFEFQPCDNTLQAECIRVNLKNSLERIF